MLDLSTRKTFVKRLAHLRSDCARRFRTDRHAELDKATPSLIEWPRFMSRCGKAFECRRNLRKLLREIIVDLRDPCCHQIVSFRYAMRGAPSLCGPHRTERSLWLRLWDGSGFPQAHTGLLVHRLPGQGIGFGGPQRCV